MSAPINWRPDRKTLAQFSEFGLFFLGLVAMPLALLKGQMVAAAVIWVLALGLRVVGWWRPEWLRPVFVGMMVVTWPIGWASSHLALALMYYLMFTPIALVFRLIGRDALQRRLDRTAATYWEAYDPNQGTERYLRQY